MNNNIKLRKYYFKIDIIIELLEKIKDYGLDVGFDNTRVNNYTLKYKDNAYVFNDYNGVLGALNLLLDTLKGDE